MGFEVECLWGRRADDVSRQTPKSTRLHGGTELLSAAQHRGPERPDNESDTKEDGLRSSLQDEAGDLAGSAVWGIVCMQITEFAQTVESRRSLVYGRAGARGT